MKVQHYIKENKHLFIASAILLTAVWLIVAIEYLIYYVHRLHEPDIEVVELRAPAPSMNVLTVNSKQRSNIPFIAPTNQRHEYSLLPNTDMQGTMLKLKETSSTTVSHIGGGMAPTAMTQGSSSSAGNRGIAMNNAGYNFTGMIYLNTSHSAFTSIGAPQANEVVNEKMGITERHEAKNGFPDENQGPLEPEDPMPVGDVVWGLILLLAGAYAGTIYKRRKNVTILCGTDRQEGK